MEKIKKINLSCQKCGHEQKSKISSGKVYYMCSYCHASFKLSEKDRLPGKGEYLGPNGEIKKFSDTK